MMKREKREVMRFYTHNFLDKNMYVCHALCIADELAVVLRLPLTFLLVIILAFNKRGEK